MSINTLERGAFCPQSAVEKRRNNSGDDSEITAAEQRDNSTGISDKKATQRPQYPGPGMGELKRHPMLAARVMPASLAHAGERRSGLQCEAFVSQRSGFAKSKMRKSEEERP
jgi:hypothetical protein